MSPKTLYDKIWDAHVAHQADDGTCLLYIDRHLVHEVTSPQAFEGLRMSGRKVRAPERTIAVPDHNVPTTEGRDTHIDNDESRIQVEALDRNARDFGVHYYPVSDVRQGIVHIVGPEQGWTLPGMTVVCGDSHTATHGAFGALAHGIGTSEVEHVLATQTLISKKSKNMKVEITGKAGPRRHRQGHHPVRHRRTGTAGGTGHVIEYCGEAIRDLSMEGRMTVCNMAIEGGRACRPDRPGPDHVRLLHGPPHAPKGAQWEAALAWWKTPEIRRRRPLGQGRDDRGRGYRAGRHMGHLARGRAADHRVGARARRFQGRQGRGGQAVAGLHGPDGGHEAVGHRHRRGVHRVSAPTAGSRICAPPPPS